MDDRLQDFSFKKSTYERPTRRWTCGRSSEGTACQAGPSDAGRCWFADRSDCAAGQYECVPSSGKNGATCTRPRHLGGKCNEGPRADGSCARPIPCQPVRCHRSTRQGIVFAVVAFSLGFATFIWSTPTWKRSFGSPGQLIHAHASVLADQGPLNQQCGYCHANASAQVAAPSEALGRIDAHANQSERCLSCHHLGSPNTALRAHGLAASPSSGTRLAGRIATAPSTNNATRDPEIRLSSLAVGGFLASMTTPIAAGSALAPANPRDVACAGCHREHRGRNALLGAMQPTQCQGCHAVSLQPFAEGHPHLLDHFDPHQPRLLTFDHTAHLEEYLALDEPWHSSACVLCHTPDRRASHMTLNGFENACSECHQEDIYDDDDSDGIVFLTGFDRVAVSSKGAAPTVRSLPPFMALLLLGSEPDPNGHDVEADLAALTAIAKGEDNPLLPEKPVDIQDRVARAVAQLFHDLGNREALSGRLKRAAGTPLDDSQIDGLTGRLLEHIPIRAAGKAWSSDTATGRIEPIAIGEWMRLDDTHRVTYRPHSHADSFMKSWYDLAITILARDKKGVRSTAAAAIVELLTGPDAPGQCFKCHAPHLPETRIEARLARADRAGGTVMEHPKVAWTASGRIDPQRELTRFAHTPHLGLLHGQCEQCHKQDSRETGTMQLASGGDVAAPAHRDFAPIELRTCATCHVPQRAGDDCSLCHQYHTTPAAPVLSLRGDPPR